jgi:hypothetical protein
VRDCLAPAGSRASTILKLRCAFFCRHKVSGYWEAHVWDGQAPRQKTDKTPRTKGKQVGAGLLAASW